MIKFIASSDYIRRQLSGVDFKNECIDTAEISGEDHLMLCISNGEMVFLRGVEIEQNVIGTSVDQYYRDWGQLVSVLTKIPDQPVVIQITEGNTRLCLDF